MNLKLTALASAISLGICIAIVAAAHLLYLGKEGTEHNEIHDLVTFIAIALPGLVISLLLALWSHQKFPKASLWIAWGSAAILAVLLPIPCIINPTWADILIFWYLGAAFIAGGLFGSTLKAKDSTKSDH